MAVRERRARAPQLYRLTLMQAITKGWSMDWIVEKATELGVSRLVPVLSARSVPRFGDKEDRARRVGKWQAQAVEALKQCGGAWLPEIAMPMGMEEALTAGWGGGPDTLGLVASFDPGARHPREWFAAWAAERRLRVQAAAIWVGPEGDFTPEELAALRDSGVRPITLGPRVLRSETASLYCLSVLAYELQWLWGGSPADPGDREGDVTRQRVKDSS
jgi:16S rRNA (uracil1498-N3)-methyltransferase